MAICLETICRRAIYTRDTRAICFAWLHIAMLRRRFVRRCRWWLSVNGYLIRAIVIKWAGGCRRWPSTLVGLGLPSTLGCPWQCCVDVWSVASGRGYQPTVTSSKLSCSGGLAIVSTLVGLGPRPSTLVGLGFVSTLGCACGDCVAESSVAGSRGLGRTLAYSKLSCGRGLGGCRTLGMDGIAAMSQQRNGTATMSQHQHGSSYQIVYKVFSPSFSALRQRVYNPRVSLLSLSSKHGPSEV